MHGLLPALTLRRLAPTRAATRSSTARFCSAQESLLTTFASAERTAKSTFHSQKASFASRTSPAKSARSSPARNKAGARTTKLLFDSTGIALQDSATVPREYQ